MRLAKRFQQSFDDLILGSCMIHVHDFSIEVREKALSSSLLLVNSIELLY